MTHRSNERPEQRSDARFSGVNLDHDRIFDIVAVVSNPVGWNTRVAHARNAVLSWLSEPNVRVTLVECAHGARGYDLEDLEAHPRVNFIRVRASSLAWNKENLMNIGIARLPHDARYIGTFDADVVFRRAGWAAATIRALDLYPVVQPWDKCYDLGPNDEHLTVHTCFASVYHAGGPVNPVGPGEKFWQGDGGPHVYPHSGFAWAWTRDVLDRLGGLLEVGAMGSGDHHMALALAGKADYSMPPGTNANYAAIVKRWEASALAHVNGKVGFVHGTIEHWFHGRKWQRYYLSRWDMFVKHGFDPITDLKYNSFRVIEFAGNKPELERDFDRYLRSRHEDVNTLT